MKLLLCCPSQLVSYEGISAPPHISLPLGILSIAAFLRQQQWGGHIDIYDARLSGKLQRQENGVTLFGDSDEEMAQHIQKAQPDVIGISNMFSAQFGRALKMAEIAKQVCPQAKVVIGGPHASSFPEEVLAEPTVDYVVMGEGEERMLALLEAIEAGVDVEEQGVLGCPEDMARLKPGKRVRVSFIWPIDKLPLPAYDMVDVERYFELQAQGFSPRPREWGKRVVTLLTSRGCPHKCVFCSIQSTMGYRWRHHSTEYVKHHIDYLLENYQIDFIHFEDDNFTHDTARYDEILDVLLDYRPIIPWDTPNGVRGDSWTHERVKKTKAAGCQYLTVAVESAVQRVIDEVVCKQLDLSQVDDVMKYCARERLRLNAFYVIGFPGETLDDVRYTIEYALERYRKYRVWPVLNIAMPLPGTDLYEEVTSKGLFTGELHYGANEITTDEFNPEILNDLYKDFQRRKLKTFVLKTLTDPFELRYNLKLLWNYRRNAVRTVKKTLFGISA